MSDTIKSIIQINGGVKASTTKLKSRELFVDKDGFLYYGPMNSDGADISEDQSPSFVRVDTASISKKLSDSSYVANKNYIDVPGLKYSGKILSFDQAYIQLGSSSRISSTEVFGFDVISGNDIVGTEGHFESLSKVVVAPGNYGIHDPSGPGVLGQLYFQIL